MKLLCRDDHDLPADRCPPHEFSAAGWDDETGRFHSFIFCAACGDIRPLEPPTIGPLDDPTPIHRTAEDGRSR